MTPDSFAFLFFFSKRERFPAIETVHELNRFSFVVSFSAAFGVEFTTKWTADFLAYKKKKEEIKIVSARDYILYQLKIAENLKFQLTILYHLAEGEDKGEGGIRG